MIDSWLAGVTFGLGSILTVLAQRLRDKWQRDREREDRGAEFQKTTLLAAQEAVIRFENAAGYFHVAQVVDHFKNKRAFGAWPVPVEVAQERVVAREELRVCRTRIADDTCRDLLERLLEEGDWLVASTAWDEAKSHREVMQERAAAAHERLGYLLRQTF